MFTKLPKPSSLPTPKPNCCIHKAGDFSPENRVKLFNDIKNNNWDCIILTHDQFGKIPQSPKIQQKTVQAELTNVELDLEVMRQQNNEVSKAALKGLENAKPI